MRPPGPFRLAPVLAALLLATPHALAQGMPPGAPPPAVTTQPVRLGSVAPQAEFVGRVEAVASFEARPRVSGTVQEVSFQEGQDVAAGQPLYVIEPAPYEAARTAAQARLAQAQARLTQASQAAERSEALRTRGTVSEAALEQAQADRAAAEGEMLAAKAQLQQAELDLSYTRIASPIAGRIGATSVTAGNYVTPQTGVLATVVQVDPIRVTFPVSDRQVLQVMQETGARTPAELADRFVPTLKLANGEPYAHPGRVEFIDNRVDPATGTLTVRALFPNPDRLLIPGQYASVLVRPEKVAQTPVVPVSAVQQDREGTYVLVLGPGNVAQQRRIAVGAQSGQQVAVAQGLREGEVVIVEGQQKARPGAPVTPIPAAQADAGGNATQASGVGGAAQGAVPTGRPAGPGPQSPAGPMANPEAANPPAGGSTSGGGSGQLGGGSGPGSGGAGGGQGGSGSGGGSGGQG